MEKIWFTGDTHFGQKRILELSKRPFSTLSEMDYTMIENWNSVVEPEDIVYHIGDFGDYNFSHKLNGKIHLLFGNYERKDTTENVVSLEFLKNNFNFSSVNDSHSLTIFLSEEKYTLVHEPSNRNVADFTLFGHIHKLQMIKKNALNVGVDCHNFFPIDLNTVLFYKKSIENHYDDEVYMP